MGRKKKKNTSTPLALGGSDTEGRIYNDIQDVWTEFEGKDGRTAWYAKGAEYWNGQGDDLEGIMGGYPETHESDISESAEFLNSVRLLRAPPPFGTVLDCGAGIGRVTGQLLVKHFQHVDLLEPNERLLKAARRDVQDPKAERFLVGTLQDFEPEHNRYDVIWIQWVLLYLPDDDLLVFLKKCCGCLRSGGAICVKENVVLDGGKWVLDREDNSISRTDSQYQSIFRQAGLQAELVVRQVLWPAHLIPVMMYCLRPVGCESTAEASAEAMPPIDGGSETK